MKKFIASFASATIFATAVAPAAMAATNVTIQGNGWRSRNRVRMLKRWIKSTTQTNNATVNASISQKAETDKNKANNNTGGPVEVTSGAAKNTLEASVEAGVNDNIDNCECDQEDEELTVEIKNNGGRSRNRVRLTNVRRMEVSQDSSLNVDIDVDQDADTGDNQANGNTGDGDDTVSVKSGKGENSVTLTVLGPLNSNM